MGLLYFLFRYKNVMPGTFYNMTAGERLLAAALAEHEMAGN